MRTRALWAGIVAAGLLAGCAATSSQTVGANPYPPVPPPIAETIPKPPVTAEALVWQPGHWNWTGSGYEWAQGQYVPAAGHGNLWMPGWWTHTSSGWQWQPPHWTS